MALQEKELMDTYKLMKYFRCATTPEEDAEVDRWLEDDPDGSHAKAYRDAHLIFTDYRDDCFHDLLSLSFV